MAHSLPAFSAPTLDALKRARRRFMPKERLSTVQWAERYRILAGGSRPGPFRFAGQPALRGIIEAVDDPRVRELWGQKSAQFGWTQGVGMNIIGRRIHLDPCPILILFPKDGAGKRFMREKLVPAIKSTPELRERIKIDKRGPENTQDYKEFEGGYIQLAGTNSPANVKSSDAPLVMVEEPDDTAKDVGGQGDAVVLGRERLKDYADTGLLVVGGTPTIDGLSKVALGMQKTDKRRFHVTCPHCGHEQTLRWSRVRWRKDNLIVHEVYGTHQPASAVYACEACVTDDDDCTSAGCWTDGIKNQLVYEASLRPDHGWRATGEFHGSAGFFINELISISPGSRFEILVTKFLEAEQALKNGNDKLMISFINNQLGEPWKLKSKAPELEILQSRSLSYVQWTVPAGGLICTAGVDVQRGGDNVIGGLYVEIRAWGAGEESWLVAWKIIPGNPLEPHVWAELDKLLNTPIRNLGGGTLGVSAASIDSGDGMTSEAVYRYVRSRKHRGFMAIKGSSNPAKEIFSAPSQSIDTTATDRAAKFGLKVYQVGVTRAKDLIIGRLALDGDGPGRIHWNEDVPLDYFQQITSQIKIPTRSGKLGYVTRAGSRDEWSDTLVYNLHAAHKLRLHTYTDARWREIEAAVRQRDLLKPTNAPTTTESVPRGTLAVPVSSVQPFTGHR